MATRNVLFTIVLGLAVVGVGCSSGDDIATESNDDIATLADEETESSDGDDAEESDAIEDETDDDTTATTTATLPELEPEDSALQFSQCMREEGIVDFPDLGIDGNGNIDLNDIPPGLQDDPDAQDALDVCQPLIEAGGFGERIREVVESPEFNDSLVEFSDCVRDEGFDVGDLTVIGLAGAAFGAPAPQAADNPEGGEREAGFGDRDGIFAKALGLDPDDADVAAAVDKCLPEIEGAMADLGFE